MTLSAPALLFDGLDANPWIDDVDDCYLDMTSDDVDNNEIDAQIVSLLLTNNDQVYYYFMN
jgi:hypothetical protein